MNLDEIFQGIKEAINDEREQQKKYRNFIKKANDEEVKALFEQLLEDEIEHENLLRSRYLALKNYWDNRT